MAKLGVIDLSGSELEQIDVSDVVFAGEVKEHLLWEAVRVQRAAKRRGTAKTKHRGEVHGTHDKMYKQKGTGNARHGSRRVVTFRGGGVVHGPRPRDYHVGMNKKAMAGALRSVLSLRAKAGDLMVVRDFTMPEIKTKALAEALDKLQAPKALLVDGSDNRWLQMSSRNLPDAQFLDVRGLNVYDVMRFPKLLMSESSLRAIEARLDGKPSRADQARAEAGGAA
jgi:large subunit ribosomal protein L4